MENLKNIKLNDGQLKAIDKIKTYLDTPYHLLDKKYLVITGPGGSGKTFLLKEALKPYAHKVIIAGATISHFAKKVLANNIGDLFEIHTLASLLNAVKHFNKKGEFSVKYSLEYAKRAIQQLNIRILVVDEISMIDDNLADLLIGLDIKLILVGDRYQLPPIEQEHDSFLFDDIDIELTQVMRFKGPLKEFSSVFINEIKKGNEGYSMDKNIISKKTLRKSVVNEIGSGYIFMQESREFLTLAAEEFRKDITNLSACRIIAYKNTSLDIINSFIRRKLFGKNIERFVENELIINSGGYDTAKIKNGDIFRVIKVRYRLRDDKIKIYRLTLIDDEGNISVADVLDTEDENNMIAYQATEEKLRNKAKYIDDWRILNTFKDSFAEFNYLYAISVHKVQGSSIKNVYVFEGEIMGVKPTSLKEKFQSLYVAITRATHRTYILNTKVKADNFSVDINKNRFSNEST